MFLALPMKYCIRRGQNFAKSPQMDLNHCFLLVLPSWPWQRYFEWSESLRDITTVLFDHCKKSKTWGAFHLDKISSWKFRKHSRSNRKVSMGSHRASFAISFLAWTKNPTKRMLQHCWRRNWNIIQKQK